MATDTRSLPAFFNTDADFQSWCQGIAAQLVVAGMVKTSDTGQINNATVTKPAGTNTSQGYEIYKFNDSLQSGTPFFFKIEYGSAGAVDRPAFWITVGTGSNGSGTLTGTLTTRTQVTANASKSAGVTLPSYCQGDASGFILVTNYDSTSNSFNIMVVVDRVADSGGNATSDGASVVLSGTGSFAQGILGGAATTSSTSGAFVGLGSIASNNPLGQGSRTVGGNVAVMPAIVIAGQMRFIRRWVLYNTADLAGNAVTVTANNLGANHTYQLLDHCAPAVIYNSASGERLAMLWE